MDFKERIEDSFSTYAAMTIQHRAIIDARDALKPSYRMAFYTQKIEKITHDKPRRKTHKSVALTMDHFYLHGNASMEELLARLARPITMRYVLEDGKGNMGTYAHLDGDAADARYTEMRLGELGGIMTNHVDDECIDLWFDNYDNTEQFPSVLPSLGYYNIVNGTVGIAVSLASSIPQFNLREVNEAMIKLLWNPDINFDEIYCPPDFATGGTILNADEVKEAIRVGRGRSALIRGTVEYDESKHVLHVSEVPYNVATDKIFNQIAALFSPDAPEGASTGIERYVDSSEDKVDMDIWISKASSPTRVTKNLYKYTNIQYYFPINMVMLDEGKKPKVFGWKDALNAHLDHEKKVRRNIHIFQLKKIDERLPIVEGICLAIANMDEVVSIIRGSKTKAEAKEKLQNRFGYNDDQANALLKFTLGKLVALELQSYKDEKEKLLAEKEYHNSALNDREVLYKEIEADLRTVAEKFGDKRRTRLMNLDYKGEDEDAEPIEKKELIIHYTNLGNIYTQESTTLLKTRRGGKGSKVKLSSNEVITKSITDDNYSSLMVFTNKGQMYNISTDELPLNSKINIKQLFELSPDEHPTAITSLNRREKVKYFIFITKKGMIKKTSAEEYNLKRGKSIKAINLKDGDEVVSVLFAQNEKVDLLTFNGNYVIIDTESLNPTGRVSMGVRAIKLNEDDYVIDASLVAPTAKFMITLSKSGLIKKTPMTEFDLCSRATKGKKISGVRDNDYIVKHLTFSENSDIIIIVNKKQIKISTKELNLLSRGATGVKAVDLKDGSIATDLLKA